MSDNRSNETVTAKDSEEKKQGANQKKRKIDLIFSDDLLYDPSQSQESLPLTPKLEEEKDEDPEQKAEEESPLPKRLRQDAPTPIVNTFEDDFKFDSTNLQEQLLDLQGLSASASSTASATSSATLDAFLDSSTEDSIDVATSVAISSTNFGDNEDPLQGLSDLGSSAAVSVASSATFDSTSFGSDYLDLSAFVSSAVADPIAQLPPAVLPFSAAASSPRSIYNGPNVSPSSSSESPPATLSLVSSSIASASILTLPKKD